VVSGALTSRMVTPGKGLPRHGAELVTETMAPKDFVIAASRTRLDRVLVAGVPIERFQLMSAVEQGSTLAAAIASLPEGWTAHRVGDIVFTYNGLDPANEAHADRWLSIAWVDPDQNFGSAREQIPWTTVSVVKLNGTVDEIAMSSFGSMLAQENEARAAIGLGALPHPRDVRAARPAVPETGAEPPESQGGAR
jgi:hypothetical protein